MAGRRLAITRNVRAVSVEALTDQLAEIEKTSLSGHGALYELNKMVTEQLLSVLPESTRQHMESLLEKASEALSNSVLTAINKTKESASSLNVGAMYKQIGKEVDAVHAELDRCEIPRTAGSGSPADRVKYFVSGYKTRLWEKEDEIRRMRVHAVGAS